MDIGEGHKLYLLEKGAGGPTVLFEAGIAATNLNWCHIQETVARFTHTVSYDRGGLGWSGPSRSARTPTNCAAELHDLLERAGMKPPYILVGHSFGGLVMRRYALSYPEEVSGIVLVDPMRCEEWPPMNPGRQAGDRQDQEAFRLRGADCAFRFGAAGSDFPALPLGCALRSSGGSGRSFRTPCAETRDRRSGQDAEGRLARRGSALVASRILCGNAQSRGGGSGHSARNARCRADPRYSGSASDAGKSTPLSEENVLRIGDNVQQVIAPTSAHWIHLDQPDLVIDSIREMIRVSSQVEAVAATV